ncbi:MAG: DapH/DapD/GlmU-related protein, partial [Rikenellaceae bacterium]
MTPINAFYLGVNSIIESYTVVDNGVGDIQIGDFSRVGLRNTLIGPVKIGNNVITAQNVVLSGLNHNYENVDQIIRKQGVTAKPIVIEDDVWVGANAVVTSGVTIGTHSIV